MTSRIDRMKTEARAEQLVSLVESVRDEAGRWTGRFRVGRLAGVGGYEVETFGFGLALWQKWSCRCGSYIRPCKHQIACRLRWERAIAEPVPAQVALDLPVQVALDLPVQVAPVRPPWVEEIDHYARRAAEVGN